MKKKLLLIIIGLFIFSSNVYGAEVGSQNLCDTSGKCGKGKASDTITLGNEKTCSNKLSTNNGSCEKQLEVPEGVGKTKINSKKVIYDVVFLVDVSDSVRKAGLASAINDTLNEGIEVLKGSDSRVKICSFSSEYHGCLDIPDIPKENGGWYKASEITKKFNFFRTDIGKEATYGGNNAYKKIPARVTGSTYTDAGLNEAKTAVLKNLKNVPMIVLITDGYPTYSSDPSGKTLDIGNLSATRYFYNAMTTMVNIKNDMKGKNPNAKLFTVGIMNKNDTLAKYFLNPTIENYDNLSSDTDKIEGNLKKMLDGKKENTKYYDTVAGLESSPEKGIFYGSVNKQNVTYKIDVAWYNKQNSTTKYIVPSEKGVKIKSMTVKFCDKNGKNCNKPSNINVNVCDKINSNKYWACDLTKQKIPKKNADKMIVTISYSGTLNLYADKTKLNYDSKKFDRVNPVDFSVVSSKDFGNLLKKELQSVVNEEDIDFETSKKKINSKLYYGVCKDKLINLNSSGTNKYYYKTNVSGVNTKGKTVNSDTYVEVNLQLNINMVEDATFNFGSPENLIYAGGGYNWTGTSVSNTFKWNYGVISTKNNPIFRSVKAVNFYKSSSNGKLSDKDLVNFGTNSIDTSEICVKTTNNNKSCSKFLSNNDLIKIVYNSLNITDQSNAFTSGIFNTVDSNNENNMKSAVSHNVKSNGISKNALNPNTSLGISYSFSLYGACIDAKTAMISYTKNGVCDDDSRTGGNKRYIPLKYPSSSAPIYASTNISSVPDIKINIKSTCSVNVKQILYDYDCGKNNESCGNSDDLKVAYKYRSIDVDNPFPKNVIPQNWSLWYSNKDNKLRIKDSYRYYPDNPLYSLDLNDRNVNTVRDITTSYVDWNNIDMNGAWKSDSWENKIGFNNNRSGGSYCELGYFNTKCDKVK